MFQLLLIAARNLAQHRRRTALLGGAIAGVSALLVLLLGLSAGMRETMLRSATTLMTGHVNVGGFYKVTAGQSAPVVTEYAKVSELIKKEIPEVDYVVQRGRGWAKLISDTASSQVGIGGIDITNEQGFRKVVQVTSGNLDDLSQPGTILIFESQAKKLEMKVGDTATISAPTVRGTNNTIDVRVAAIAKDIGMMSAWNVFIPNASLRALYQLKEDATGALYVYLKDMKAVPQVQQRLREKLSAAGYLLMDNDPQAFWMKFQTVNREDWTGQKLDVTNWEDEISFMKWTVMLIDGLSYMLIAVLLVIIAIGVMNTMWIAIRERTREIGTLRAIGMQKPRVLMMFVMEAFLLGFGSAMFGAVLGFILCAGISSANVAVPVAAQLFLMTDHLVLQPNLGTVFGSIVFIAGCVTFISVIPSFLAARMKPITAMHHVG